MAWIMTRLAVLATAAAVLLSSAEQAAAARAGRTLATYSPGSSQKATVVKYDWHVRIKRAAPDCFSKEVIVVNGEFQPSITVRQGNILQVVLHNELPADYPASTAGISIHWHGFSLVSPNHTAAWYDGTPYVVQCPVKTGNHFVYRFTVTENPGTYFWHDHSSANRADGLQGPLIVLPPEGTTPPGTPHYDSEETVFIQDWFHAQGPVLAFHLQRPFDPALATNKTGAWEWVGLPQSIIMNGQGYYGDCQLNPAGGAALLPCNVSAVTVKPDESQQQPWASASNPGCAHYTTTVKPGETRLYRLINAGTLMYQTVCFEQHAVIVVAADAYPTQHVHTECVDVNAGQRYDVLLTANHPSRTYFITVASQFRPGAPNGYGFLQYSNATAGGLPSTPTVQENATLPWNQSQIDKACSLQRIKINTALLPGLAPPERTAFFGVNLTQPLVKPTGQIRWALNNVAHSENPSCSALGLELKANKNYLHQHDAGSGPNGTLNPLGAGVLGTQNGNDVGVKNKRFVYLNDSFPINPVAGLHVVHVTNGEVLDVVVQNNAANAFNGDYRPNNGRSAAEQHPFHLHGHHFWALAIGMGVYDDALNRSSLNTVDPPYRDVVNIPMGGYAVLRFEAGNPGLWLFHCHILWHQAIGQALIFADSVSKLGPAPDNLPACPASCPATFAPWAPATIQQLYGDSPYELPLAP